MQNIIINLKGYRFVLWAWLAFLVLNACSRFALLLLFTDSLNADSWMTLLYGMRMDTIVFSAFALFFVLFYTLGLRLLLRLALAGFAVLVVYLEVATFFFFEQFASRPNYLFIEHLKNAKEIFLMIWGLYPLGVMLVLPLLGVLAAVVFKYSQGIHIEERWVRRWQVLPLLVVVLFLGMRSSLDASTPNQSFYTFSHDNNKNELANNTIFSILYAWHWAENEHFGSYGDLSESEAYQLIRQQNGFMGDDRLIRQQISAFSGKKNVILIILESFGHQYVGYLGGTPTTPNLDRLAAQGFAFNHMYAAGNRTSWGVSSVLTGLYPLPGREYVKALKSQQHFYTIAQSFKEQGYHNTFLYSGDADFDNMRAFMLSNGYDQVLGKEVFDAEQDKRTWGYADEDLYKKALTLIEKQQQPYFLTLLTLSSHEPFDYPAGKTPLYPDAPEQGFANSIKYADYALGKFYKVLKDKGLLKDTVVALIADHGASAYGSEDVPVDKYRIAAMLLSEDLAAQQYDNIASQVDFGPSLLDLAGLDVWLPTTGVSVFQQQHDAALLMYQQNYAYVRPDGVVIYKDGQAPKQGNMDADAVRQGLAYILAPHFLYESSAYGVTQRSPKKP